MIVCIDSQIFVWGIKKDSTAGQEDMIPKAEFFFKWVDEHKHNLLIPSIVVAEVLAPEPIEKYNDYLQIINQNFIVVNFDSRAATKYAQLLNGKFDNLKELAKENGIRREKMKFDHIVIACALIGKAKCIYTFDKGLKTFATGLIDVKELPPLPSRQADLFE